MNESKANPTLPRSMSDGVPFRDLVAGIFMLAVPCAAKTPPGDTGAQADGKWTVADRRNVVEWSHAEHGHGGSGRLHRLEHGPLFGAGSSAPSPAFRVQLGCLR
jgi:hypothetical protein